MTNRFFSDFRYALRIMAQRPSFTALAVLTLALGIGANTALFSVTDAVLLRSLPYADPDRLILASAERAENTSTIEPFSYPRFSFLVEHAKSFTGLAAFTREVFNMTGRGEPEQMQAGRVSANFFNVLGVQPARGRAFSTQEGQPGGANVVVISHAFWLRRFGGNPDAVGSSLTLDSTNYTVIGILPAKFEFPLLGGGADLWVTRIFLLNITTPEHIRSGAGYLSAVGRLRPGLRVREAQAEMEVLSRQYRQAYPAMPDATPNLQIRISDLRERTVANVRPAILMLAGAVGLLLLIACANVASLLLARALARRREMAVRAALGASRLTLIRQLLKESVLLAFVSGTAGILIGNWTIAAVASWASSHLPRASAIAMDARALAFTLGISLLTGVLFGLAPAIQISRPDLNAILRAEGRGGSSTRRRNLLGNLLVASQVALSVILLVSAGLLIRSFVRLQSLALGFDPRNVLTLTLSLPPTRYSTAQQMVAFYDRLVKEVEKVPGVTSAAVASALPVNPSRISPVLAEGQPAVPLGQRPLFVIQTISKEYPRTLRLPLLRGREFSENDTSQSSRVALVNDTLVRRFWSHENPIGKHLLLGRMPQPTEVVGVVADVRNVSLAAAAEPEVILPFPQLPWAAMNLIVRTGVTPRSVVEAVRQALARVDPDQPVTAVQTLEEVLASSESQRRFTMYLLGAFSICALLLAVVGIYGVISYSVEERRQEMGIRIAIGAERGDILRLVVGQALRVAAAGVITGLAAALVVTRWMAALLFQVSATDPLSLAGTATLLITVAAIASYLPAHRAACNDPLHQLRHE